MSRRNRQPTNRFQQGWRWGWCLKFNGRLQSRISLRSWDMADHPGKAQVPSNRHKVGYRSWQKSGF